MTLRSGNRSCFIVHATRGVLPLALFLAASAGVAQTNYEAESAFLSHGAQADNCAYCSGGRFVRHIGGDNGGTVAFSVVVPADGLYPVTVQYDVGDDRSFRIRVNGEFTYDRIFPRTGGRGGISSQALLAPLRAGTNTVTFGNDNEAGPELDRLALGAALAQASAIAGSLEGTNGLPLAGVEVRLFGELEGRTLTDARGYYEFSSLPPGDYYVRPMSTGTLFGPSERFTSAHFPATNRLDFKARQVRAGTPGKPAVMLAGKWRLEYDLDSGLTDCFFEGKLVLAGVFAQARLPEPVTSLDYQSHKLRRRPLDDAFGHGTEFLVESANTPVDTMTQRFRLYDGANFFLADVAVSRSPVVSARYLAPVVSQTRSSFLPGGDNRALFVPFDNDKWVRYDAVPFGHEITSCEVSALYNSARRQGLVLGSLEHDTWKTGVRSATARDALTGVELFGGLASPKTRDTLPHGQVSGPSIRSPLMFIGCFADWRDGLDAYARANAVLAPARAWTNGVPFGWNSWGKLQGRLTYDKAIQVSDFFARELQPHHFENRGTVYIGLDSGWNRFTEDELKRFVEHCQAHGQQAGIYFTPFAGWRAGDEAAVEGSDFKYQDICLYARGRRQSIDGGVALDPTHPGTRQRIQFLVNRFKAAGFAYIKADFMTHGALEADRYFDPKITTGMQAYHDGMRFVAETIGPGMYLNLSIAPLFPAQFANSRRIACDSFGDIGNIEYTLNSLTYGWWLGGVYDYNDADHVVLAGYTEGENRARVTSAVVTGIFISGDDFSEDGPGIGKERARKFLTNPEINALARQRRPFRPVEGDTGRAAATLFTCAAGADLYLAAFNYANTNTSFDVDLARAGRPAAGPVRATELWSGASLLLTNSLGIRLGPADAAIYKLVQSAP